VTTGYGPECFTIRGGERERQYPYTLQAHYYSRGPMGYGMGKLEIIEHDGHGNLTFKERPFVVMADRAFGCATACGAAACRLIWLLGGLLLFHDGASDGGIRRNRSRVSARGPEE